MSEVKKGLAVPEAVATLGHAAALALLWRWAPGGWPSLAALALVLAPIPARTSRARLAIAVLHVLAAIGATAGEVLVAGAAGAGGDGLAVALARGLVLAGAVAERRRTIGGGGGAFVAAPVALAVLTAGALAAGGTTTLGDVLCAAIAVGAAVASVAMTHVAGAARRPVLALSLAHAALSAAIFVLLLGLQDRPRGGAQGAAPPVPASAPRPSVALATEVVFDGGGSPEASAPTVVGTVRVTGGRSTERGLLLRATALERLDEDGFHPASGTRTGEAQETFEPGELERIDAPSPVRLAVELARAPEGYLLTQGVPRHLAGARAVRDRAGNLRLARGLRAPLAYTLDAVECPDDEELLQTRAASDAPELLALPAAVRGDPDLRALAERLAHGTSTAHGLARAVEKALTGDYDYDLARSHRSRGLLRSVRRFLLEEKRGACTEFATAMVVLLRLEDVPARLVTGYRVDPPQRDASGTWTIQSADAHAWVEVPLEGAGFVAYDPTAPLRGPGADEGSRPEARAYGPTIDAIPGRSALLASLGLLAALAAGGAALHLGRRARRRRERSRPRSGSLEPAVVSACAALFALAERRGFALDGPETLLAFAERRAEREGSGPADRELVRAVALYYAIRFSGREASPPALAQLHALVAAAAG
jgi:transglutaminase-like putative cysteine protease